MDRVVRIGNSIPQIHQSHDGGTRADHLEACERVALNVDEVATGCLLACSAVAP